MAGKAGTLWMGDLEPYMDDLFIKESFRGMGENVSQCKIIKNRVTGLPLGYGFLEFGDDASALRALHKCNGKLIPNSAPPKRFKLNHASYGKDQDFSIFVGDLTPEIDDLTLFNCFIARYPSTRSAKVVLDTQGTTKGYGFIRFAEEAEQQRALVEMQGSTSLGSKPIRVSLATPKSKQQLMIQTMAAPAPGVPDYSAYYQSAYQRQYQDYYQNYQNYQQYYNQYNYSQYYNQQPAPVDPAAYQYQQYGQPAAYDGYTAAGTQAYGSTYNTDEPELEEHDKPLDIPKQNEELMAKNEEFYSSLVNCRWTSPEDLGTTKAPPVS